MAAKGSQYSANNSPQQPPASYTATSQMPVMGLRSNTTPAPPPKIRTKGTGLELKPHEVDRIASPGNEKRLT